MSSSDPLPFIFRAAEAADLVRQACETLSFIRLVDEDTRSRVVSAYRVLVDSGVSPHMLFQKPIPGQAMLIYLLDRYLAVAELTEEAAHEYRETFADLEAFLPQAESGDDSADTRALVTKMEDAVARYPKTCNGRLKSAFIQAMFMSQGETASSESFGKSHDRYHDALHDILVAAGIGGVPAVGSTFDPTDLIYAPDLVTSGIWRMVPGRFAVMTLDAEVLAMPILVLPDEIIPFFHGGDLEAGDSSPLQFIGINRIYTGSVTRGSRQAYMPHPPVMLYLDRDMQQAARQLVEGQKPDTAPSLVFCKTGDASCYEVVFAHISEGSAYAIADVGSGAFADGFMLEPLDLLSAGIRNDWAWLPGRGAVLQIPASVTMPGSDHLIPLWLAGFFFTDSTVSSLPITLSYAGRIHVATLRVDGSAIVLHLHTPFLILVREQFSRAAAAYRDLLISFEQTSRNTYTVHFSTTADSLTMIRARNTSADLVAHPNPATEGDDDDVERSSPVVLRCRNAVYTDGFVLTDTQLATATVKRDWAMLATGEVVLVIYDNRIDNCCWTIPSWLSSWIGHSDEESAQITLIYDRIPYHAKLTPRYQWLYLGEHLADIVIDRSYRACDAGRYHLVIFERTADDEYVLHFSESATTLSVSAVAARKNLARRVAEPEPVRRPIRVSLDKERVAQADSDLSETVRLLHIDYEDDGVPAAPAPVAVSVGDGWDGFMAALTPVQIEVLRLLLADPVPAAALKAVASREGRLLASIYDGINETAATATGDVIIEDGQIIDEYRDEVSAVLDRVNA